MVGRLVVVVVAAVVVVMVVLVAMLFACWLYCILVGVAVALPVCSLSFRLLLRAASACFACATGKHAA